ncbi:hypothetical protein MAGR_62400 [Mycolicibacterium agri]|uniref:Uncharacterized protein n=1 Tax=Mycolicibacterium agri TaxID=36811 RepID=A0A7I9WBL8_MYCAG|nr:hypothetical protein MAGR_62400 [Mycolicibacterium agri]
MLEIVSCEFGADRGGQMMLYIADRHPAGIKRDDHVIEPAQAPRTLGDQRRSEAPVAIARDRQPDVTDLTGHGLGGEPVTGVGQLPPDRIALLITQMVAQLGGQSALQNGFDHLRQKAALAGQLQLACVDLGQHVV